jgi:hypothetical protein
MRQANMTIPPRLGRDLAVHLTVSNALDGASRLLSDAQRFGFAIRSVRIDVLKDDLASVQMTLAVQPNTDTVQISSRLARHVSVLSVETL